MQYYIKIKIFKAILKIRVTLICHSSSFSFTLPWRSQFWNSKTMKNKIWHSLLVKKMISQTGIGNRSAILLNRFRAFYVDSIGVNCLLCVSSEHWVGTCSPGTGTFHRKFRVTDALIYLQLTKRHFILFQHEFLINKAIWFAEIWYKLAINILN